MKPGFFTYWCIIFIGAQSLDRLHKCFSKFTIDRILVLQGYSIAELWADKINSISCEVRNLPVTTHELYACLMVMLF
jgi:hypothetical protein